MLKSDFLCIGKSPMTKMESDILSCILCKGFGPSTFRRTQKKILNYYKTRFFCGFELIALKSMGLVRSFKN